MSTLRKFTSGFQEPWTKDQISAGFQHYFELYGEYPTAHQIDEFEYLPSSRSIQRTFGGLVSLRRELFPESITNFTMGEYRSVKAKEAYANGRDFEQEFYEYLVSHFEEISVHEHKVIRPGHVNCDFYIYLVEDKGIVIDIFYAYSLRNLVNVVNLKLKRYSLINQETYLVAVGNPNLVTDLLSAKMQNKLIKLPGHITVVLEQTFKDGIMKDLKTRSQFCKG